MHTRTITATELKNKTSEILNEVSYGKHIAVIERHGKVVARLVPPEEKKMKKVDLDKALRETFGSIPDFPDITKFRVSRKKTFSL